VLLQEVACRCLTGVCAVPSGPHAIYLERGVESILGALGEELQYTHNESMKKSPQESEVSMCLSERSRSTVESLLFLLCAVTVNETVKAHFAKMRAVPCLLALLDHRYPAAFLKLVLSALDAVSLVDSRGEAVGWAPEEINALTRFVLQQEALAAAQAQSDSMVTPIKVRMPALDFSSLQSNNKPVTIKNVVDACRGGNEPKRSKLDTQLLVVSGPEMSTFVGNQVAPFGSSISTDIPKSNSIHPSVSSTTESNLEHSVNEMFAIASKLISMVEGASELHKEETAVVPKSAPEKTRTSKWLPKVPKPSRDKDEEANDLAASVSTTLHWQDQLDRCDEELDGLQEQVLALEVTHSKHPTQTASHQATEPGPNKTRRRVESEFKAWLRENTNDADETRSVAESESDVASAEQSKAELTQLRLRVETKQSERKEIFTKLQRFQDEQKKLATVVQTRQAITHPSQLQDMARSLAQLREDILQGLRNPHMLPNTRTSRATSAPRTQTSADASMREAKLEQSLSVGVQLSQIISRRVLYSWQAWCLLQRLQENSSLLAQFGSS